MCDVPRLPAFCAVAFCGTRAKGNELEDQADVIVEGDDGAEDRKVLMIGN